MKKQSTYAILNTSSPDYLKVTKTLKDRHAAKGINFVPRLSLDGFKALIQIKPDVVFRLSDFSPASLNATNDKSATGKTDAEWAEHKVKVTDKDQWERDAGLGTRAVDAREPDY